MNTRQKIKAAIQHLTKHNWFDRKRLLETLKEADEELEKQNWWNTQDQDEEFADEPFEQG